MSTINMVKNIKELFPDYVLLVKIGSFYETYNNDSKIMFYLFDYKVKRLASGNDVAGFPLVSLNRVLSILEKRNINYLVVDKKHNYEEECKMNYKKKNKYYEILKIASDKIDIISRIDRIKEYLFLNKNKIGIVEDLLYER